MTLPAVAVVASPRGGGGVALNPDPPRGWGCAVVCLATAAALRAGSAFGVVRALGGPLGPPWDLLFCEKCEETWKVHY